MQKDEAWGSVPGQRSSYLLIRPRGGGFLDVLRYALSRNQRIKDKFLELRVGKDEEIEKPSMLVILVLMILERLRIPMEYTGFLVDHFLNFWSANDGFFGLLLNLIQVKVVIPKRGTKTFLSTIGQLDRRFSLFKKWNIVEHLESINSVNLKSPGSVKIDPENRGLIDLCMMASKLAYENAEVVQNVVNNDLKMHLVGFLDGYNYYQKQHSTKVFILTDKEKDANLIVVSFRGTDPFNAYNWETDVNYGWYRIPNVGKLHIGFLEAMGLGSRNNQEKLDYNLLNQTSSEEEDRKKYGPEMDKKSAYYVVLNTLKRLVLENKNARIVVTGHSLGGALAILFPTLMVAKKDEEIMDKLLAVYTFGQPRIGNIEIVNFMKDKMKDRYFRVVYCNDVVPRLPFDNKFFLYKHFGDCLYYNSFYNEEKLEDVIYPNGGLLYHIFGYVNSVWELVRGLTMWLTHGLEYKEGWFRIIFRILGLVVPGVSDHCTTDYVNSVRLGPKDDRSPFHEERFLKQKLSSRK